MTENNTDDEQDVPRTQLGILGTIAEPTGTDGCIVSLHQGSPQVLMIRGSFHEMSLFLLALPVPFA